MCFSYLYCALAIAFGVYRIFISVKLICAGRFFLGCAELSQSQTAGQCVAGLIYQLLPCVLISRHPVHQTSRVRANELADGRSTLSGSFV